MQVDQCIFRFPFSKPTAYQVWNSIYLVVVHDRCTDTNGAGSFPDFYLFKGPIGLFLEHGFAPVVSNVDKRRFKLHQGVQVVIYRTYGLPL
jgi:hypothetical protein